MIVEFPGPSNAKAGKKVATTLDVESVDDSTSSEDDSSSDRVGVGSADSEIGLSSSEEESEPEAASEKKAGTRKPSKKALENATNEVSALIISDTCSTERLTRQQQPYFPADKQPPKSTSKGKKVGAMPMVKVKVEKTSNDATEEDEDDGEDEDGGHKIGHSKPARTAERIYKKALKILKFKLYFENFFPTDDDKIGLPSSCWAAAIASIGEIDGGPAAARSMFHDFGYEDMVCALTSSSVPPFLIPRPPTLSSKSVSAPSGARL